MKSRTIKSVTLFSCIVAIAVVLHKCSMDDTALTQTTYLYVYLTIVPLFIAIIFALNNDNAFSIRRLVYYIVTFITFCLVATYILPNLSESILSLLEYGIFTAILFLILSLVYTMNSIYIKNRADASLDIAFFGIQCLLLLYIIHRQLKKNKPKKIVLFKGKMFLDTEENVYLANSLDLHNDSDSPTIKYSLSFWVHINQPSKSKAVFPILLYGDENNPKPCINYMYDVNEKKSVFNIDFSGKTHNRDSTNVNIIATHQKWNNFVINYNGSTVDVFLNGILHKSISLTSNMPIYSINDTISIGSDKLKLNGAIAHVVFYHYTLSSHQILGRYRVGVNTINL